jgi:hypothetical protein
LAPTDATDPTRRSLDGRAVRSFRLRVCRLGSGALAIDSARQPED